MLYINFSYFLSYRFLIARKINRIIAYFIFSSLIVFADQLRYFYFFVLLLWSRVTVCSGGLFICVVYKNCDCCQFFVFFFIISLLVMSSTASFA